MDKTGQIQQKRAAIIKVFYEVPFLMAKHLKAYTIAESLKMPAAKNLGQDSNWRAGCGKVKFSFPAIL